ncbi:BatD family protein [uncultured Psychroserpens sp.]|uniref:BatD family protein n=1 Tax=uncultured Psychroserpens sp. TaxID=255436 RepID=UPI0026297872|nr:BatD family protein [uncultured Psychroserpens sp.]
MKHLNFIHVINSYGKRVILFLACCLFFVLTSNAQVTSSIDTTKIKIGEQITFKVEVDADTTDLVVFPEGQTFGPLEMIESYKIDTTKNEAKFKLIKTYGLTQFDSGSYKIPKQKIIVGTKTYFTDSLHVEVYTVAVDTTKQSLYGIKPMIEVEKASSDWWIYLLITLVALGFIAFLLYWFIWRKKPLTEEEEIAMLPPYDRAKLALKKLDESNYLQRSELKDYYSELTFIIRKYLDEKVYDRALESTTDELVGRLNLLRDANQIELSTSDINNIETILKRADLVKFAKSAPDIELAKIDRNTIDVEIDQVKEALPEPTEEEKLLDKQYKEEQELKKKRRKIILTVGASILILIATYVGFGLKYGFKYVTDTIIGNEAKELLEGDWVQSDYGVPPIMISTPVVLERIELQAIDSTQQLKRTAFAYGDVNSSFNIGVGTTKYNLQEGEEIDINGAVEETIKSFENNGARNIVVKREQFITPNAAEGLKVFGTGEFPTDVEGQYRSGEYVILIFVSDDKSVMQKIALVWNNKDEYTNDIMDRVLNSVELKKVEE